MAQQVRWGIVGLGSIAHTFAKDLALVTGGSLVAVASRSIQKAKEFANEYGAVAFQGRMKLVGRKWLWTETFEMFFAHPQVCPLAFDLVFSGVFCLVNLEKLVDVRGLFFHVFSGAFASPGQAHLFD